jgi:hypothetical protein
MFCHHTIVNPRHTHFPRTVVGIVAFVNDRFHSPVPAVRYGPRSPYILCSFSLPCPNNHLYFTSKNLSSSVDHHILSSNCILANTVDGE